MNNQMIKSSNLMPRRTFYKKLARNLLIGLSLMLASLFAGMCGYRYFEGLSWLDAYLNAAMILGGMGPVAELHTTAGKLFAGTYALFAGTIFLVVIAIMFAPVIHRVFLKFHLEDNQGKGN